MQETIIAFGGSCHWCTEAVFQSLTGVSDVQQGWVKSTLENDTFSEAVIVSFDAKKIPLTILCEIHLLTHQSTSLHSMRKKYRSAMYFYTSKQEKELKIILSNIQKGFDKKIITQILPFNGFKPSRETITNYYYDNPAKPFCEQFINPKLKLLLERFSDFTDLKKLNHLV